MRCWPCLFVLVNGLLIFDEGLEPGFIVNNARSDRRLASGGAQGSAMCWAWNNSFAPTPTGVGYSNIEFTNLATNYTLRTSNFTHVRFWMRTDCPPGKGASLQVFPEWLNNTVPPDGEVAVNNTWQQYAFPLAHFAYPDPDPTLFIFRSLLFVIQRDLPETCEYFVDQIELVGLTGCDLVTVTSSAAAVNVDCNRTNTNVKPGPISPIVNITAETNATAVVFILPSTGGQTIDSTGTPVRTVGGGCHADKVNCEWWDEINQQWSAEGCTNNGTVALGDGQTGVVCDCVHLTLFALVARREFDPLPLCQTSEADFVFVAIYAVIGCYCVIQLVRSRSLCNQGPKNALISGCDTLGLVLVSSLVVCALRILSLILKPFLNVGGLTILYALPSFLQLLTFTHLCITWFTVVRFSMQSTNPYQKMRFLFYGLNGLYFLSTVGISIAIASSSDVITDLARAGAYLLASFSLVLGLGLLFSGLTLVNELRKATRAVASSVQSTAVTESLMRKSLFVACVLAACWCGQAIAGFLAISGEALDTQSGLQSADVAFYVLDLLCLLLLLYFFYAAVSKAVMKRSEATNSALSFDKTSPRESRKDEVSNNNSSRAHHHHRENSNSSLGTSPEIHHGREDSSAAIMLQQRDPIDNSRLVSPASHSTR